MRRILRSCRNFTRYEGKPCVAFCNEHGKLHLNLRVNSRASATLVCAR